MTSLILWRHGQTTFNARRRIMGQMDVELTDLGREQAAAAAARLAEFAPDHIVASDLRRAVDTAAALAALTGRKVVLDARLRERSFGPWQGCNSAEIAERWPTEYVRWMAGEPLGLGIETVEEVTKRCAAAITDALAVAPGGTVVVATHGAAARFGCAALLGWTTAMAQTINILDNCHWSELRLRPDRGWRLWSHNVH